MPGRFGSAVVGLVAGALLSFVALFIALALAQASVVLGCVPVGPGQNLGTGAPFLAYECSGGWVLMEPLPEEPRDYGNAI
jgi:hypothetical protein